MLVVAATPSSDSARPTAASMQAARQHGHARSAWPGAAFPRRLRRVCRTAPPGAFSPQAERKVRDKLLSSVDVKQEPGHGHASLES